MTTLEWLLDSDPSIRWQVLRDLAGAPARVVEAERARIATEGWGAHLLAAQSPDGRWGSGPCTTYLESPDGSAVATLMLLREMGIDPADGAARRAVARVRDHIRHHEGGKPFFEGEVEPCINGRVVAIGAPFGEIDGPLVHRLLECERARGTDAAVADARRRGEEYLLARGMFRSLRTGQIIGPLQNPHRLPHHFGVVTESEGAPSRWNTLRALRVLTWAGQAPGLD